MLTLVVEGRVPLFGELKGNADVKRGASNAPRVEYSKLVYTILRDEIGKINRFYPLVEVWKVCIMPDHIHMIVRVKEDLPEDKHLGYAVRGFKAGCTKAWWRLTGVETHYSTFAHGIMNNVPSYLRLKPQALRLHSG